MWLSRWVIPAVSKAHSASIFKVKYNSCSSWSAWPRRCRHYDPSKSWQLLTHQHSITSQKTTFHKYTSVQTPNTNYLLDKWEGVLIDHRRICIGHGENHSDAAGQGSSSAWSKVFFMCCAWLTHMDMDINEARQLHHLSWRHAVCVRFHRRCAANWSQCLLSDRSIRYMHWHILSTLHLTQQVPLQHETLWTAFFCVITCCNNTEENSSQLFRGGILKSRNETSSLYQRSQTQSLPVPLYGPLTDLIAIIQCDSAECQLFIENVFQQVSRPNMLQCPWTVTNITHQQTEMKMQ